MAGWVKKMLPQPKLVSIVALTVEKEDKEVIYDLLEVDE